MSNISEQCESFKNAQNIQKYFKTFYFTPGSINGFARAIVCYYLGFDSSLVNPIENKIRENVKLSMIDIHNMPIKEDYINSINFGMTIINYSVPDILSKYNTRFLKTEDNCALDSEFSEILYRETMKKYSESLDIPKVIRNIVLEYLDFKFYKAFDREKNEIYLK